jgi:hypothetical protein
MQSACDILYCHLCPVWPTFGKKVIEHIMCVLIFSTTFVWNISHSKKNSVRYYHKCKKVFILSTCYSCQILMQLAIFEKYLNIKFCEICPVGAELFCADGRTDRTKPIVAFCSLKCRYKHVCLHMFKLCRLLRWFCVMTAYQQSCMIIKIVIWNEYRNKWSHLKVLSHCSHEQLKKTMKHTQA